ncbi:hypothetical protein EW026_g1762 [Hermanssonia centrifuga]|uniref:Uncharacterized protein n=1 Tax=Hermanssonia centrifuga TaxID=98765 RepID=A0A4S4KRA1_9APHY|nr:hypothetical protein EW026_g1762 [Hermanssonia centrifuga]
MYPPPADCDTSSSFKRCGDLWDEYGTAVFEAEQHVYRLDSGIFVELSRYWRNIFTQAHPDERKWYEGWPLFNLAVPARAARHFFKAIQGYKKKEWKAEREDVIALADVLQLSRLWQVDKLYWSCLDGLKRTFPSNLASYEGISMPPKFPTMASRFHVANVLREENILDLLPGALLLCCTSFTKLTDGCAELTPEGETVQLSAENMEAVSSGRARLKQYADACREPSDRCQYFPVRCYAALKSNAFEDPPCPYCIASWFWSPKSEGTRNPAWNEMCSIFD